MTVDTTEPTVRRSEFGMLTEAAFERSRLRLGIPQRAQRSIHNHEVTRDGIRHVAYAYGDDNPNCDPAYAAATRWGTLLAPPAFLYTVGEDAAPVPDAIRRRC